MAAFLNVLKSFTPQTIAPNQTSRIRITLFNGNDFPVTGISISDILPVGIVIAPSPNYTFGGAWTINPSSTPMPSDTSWSVSGGELPAADEGNSQGYVEVNVTGVIPGSYFNTLFKPSGAGIVTSNDTAPSPSQGTQPTPSQTLTITAPTPKKKNRKGALNMICCDPNKFPDKVCPPQVQMNGYVYRRISEKCYVLVKK